MMMLYKYLPPDRFDILDSGLIAYPPPWLFNDPFEASPLYAANDGESVALAEAGNPNWQALKHEEREIILEQIRDLDAAYGARRLTLEHATSLVGVLSLSEKNDNLLMWAHYTVQHTGFVVGFDTAHPSWTAPGRRLGPPGEPTRVTYSDERPRPLRITDTAPEHIWYTKSSEWGYEREWRVTRLLRTPVKTVKNPAGETIPLHQFPKEAVREVILGCRTSPPFGLEIMRALVETEYRGCSLLRAELAPHAFKLNIIPEPGFRPAAL